MFRFFQIVVYMWYSFLVASECLNAPEDRGFGRYVGFMGIIYGMACLSERTFLGEVNIVNNVILVNILATPLALFLNVKKGSYDVKIAMMIFLLMPVPLALVTWGRQAYCSIRMASILNNLQRNSPTLEHVDLSHCFLANEGAMEIAKALKKKNGETNGHKTHLKTLVFRDNFIGDRGAIALARALLDDDDGSSSKSSVTSLDLTSNHIHDTGAKKLKEALYSDETLLTELILNSNFVNDGYLYA